MKKANIVMLESNVNKLSY